MTQPQTTAAQCPDFDAIYEEYRDPLFRYASSHMHNVHTEEVRDLVADVWLKIYEALPEWQDRGLPIGAWLYRAMRNMIIDWLRARKGRKPVTLDLSLHDGPDEWAESDVLAVLSDEVMTEIIEALDTREGEVIRLVYVEGWRLTDVAQFREETLDAIKKRHRRALGRVRTYLETGATRRRRQPKTA